jgi:hypothetical protein
MSSIKLTDQFGIDISAQPAESSALWKYVQQLPALQLNSLDISKLGGLTLDDPALRSLSTGVTFQEPVSLGGAALTVGAGVNGSISIVGDDHDLPGHEDAIELAKGACYVRFGIKATASAGVSATSGLLQFGAVPSAEVDLASLTPFAPAAGVSLLTAIQRTVSAFALPATCDDLAALEARQISQVGVTGKLTFSGTANLLAVVNPLASASLPAPLPAVSVSAGSSVTVGATCVIETEYEIVARKLENGSVRIGWYRKAGREITVQVAASEGITAGFGGTDVVAQLIGAISANPRADLEEWKSAAVPDSQADAIQAAIEAAVCRKLQIAVEAEFTAASSESAVFLYDIVPGSLNAESRAAIEQALRGDLTGLHAPDLAGVSAVRSVWDNLRKRELEMEVNLLGILNYRSVTSLSLQGKVLYEPATGALVISDAASAQRIESTQVNFGADTQKLRHVLAEAFLITAAYHCAGQVAGGPVLRCSQSFFELQNSTSRDDMARKLRIGSALNLLSADEAGVPAGITSFGRTLCAASADYDDALTERLFLDNSGSPLPREAYEAAGRQAIQLIVNQGDTDEVRRRPAVEDPLWEDMKQAGQPGFSSIFPGVAAPLLADITADYTTIQWWADAMSQTAGELGKVRTWLAQHPNSPAADPDFQAVRDRLAGYLRGVASNTRDEFGQPWGLIAMSRLAGATAPARFFLMSPLLSRDKRRALTAGQQG